VLVDTGAWLAAFHRRDQYHAEAARTLTQLRVERARLVVADLMLAKAVNPIGVSGGIGALMEEKRQRWRRLCLGRNNHTPPERFPYRRARARPRAWWLKLREVEVLGFPAGRLSSRSPPGNLTGLRGIWPIRCWHQSMGRCNQRRWCYNRYLHGPSVNSRAGPRCIGSATT
jgi:hypothetical protein